MDMVFDINVFSDDSDSDDDLNDFANIVDIRPHIIRERPDQMNIWNDMEFINRFRLSKGSVRIVLQLIENRIRFPTERNFALTPLQQLLICLRFYASGNMLLSIGDLAGVHKSTVSTVVKRVTSAICEIKNEFLKMPDGEEKVIIQQGFYNIASFPRVLLAVDGTHVRIQSPGGNEAERFRNRKGYFSLNVMAACDHQLKIRNVVAIWPGASHDTNVFDNSALKAHFEHGLENNCFLLADSGYSVSKYVMTPLLDPATEAERRYNESQIRIKNPIERTFGIWKRRFPVLALGSRLKLETTQDVVVATAVLHNIAIIENEPELEVDPEIQRLIDEFILGENLADHNNDSYRAELINQYFARL